MDIMTILGLIVGLSAVYYTMYAGGIVSLLYNPVAAILVFGGTFGAIMVTYPWNTLQRAPKALLLTIFPQKRLSTIHYITQLVSLSEKAKKNGLDSLQEDLPKLKDPFLSDGLQMLLDGFDPEL